MTTQGLWQLEAVGDAQSVYAAAETLGFLEDMEALSLSVFDVKDGVRLEAGFATQAEAEAASDRIGLASSVRYIPPHDWVSEVQRDLAPVVAGQFILHGSHDRDQKFPDDRVPIEVEAGPAFGSGHHPTTRGCLEIFSALPRKSVASVLDVGCGTGVLAIAAALTTDARVVATDIDPDAVAVTRATAERNGATLSVFCADGLDAPGVAGTYDLVFANILAGPLKALAPDIEKATRKGGLLIVSGLLDAQAPVMLSAYAEQGFAEDHRLSIEGWTTLLLRKA